MMYELPTAFVFGGDTYEIRSDYRAILDIITALNDPELDSQEKMIVSLGIFYPRFDEMNVTDYQEAIRKCFWFINGGKDNSEMDAQPHKLIDWEKDFRYIASPINKAIHTDIRAVEYCHWWTFLSYFDDIGECTLSQIVHIRDLKARHKPLDKQDREWYRKNRHLVDMETHYTNAENEILRKWGGM